jgi:hypothetical protein
MVYSTSTIANESVKMAIYVVSAGQLLGSNSERTIKAFAEASGRPNYVIKALHIWDEYIKAYFPSVFGDSIIQAYKSGKYNMEGKDETELFLRDLVEYISPKPGSELAEAGDNMAVAKDCWNAMLFGRNNDPEYGLREKALVAKLAGIEYAVKNSTSLNKLAVVVASDTNRAHFEKLEYYLKQYLGEPEEDAGQGHTYLDGHVIFKNSFEQGLGKENLASEGIKEILQLHSDVEEVKVFVCHRGMDTDSIEHNFERYSGDEGSRPVNAAFISGTQGMFEDITNHVAAQVEYA